MDTELTEIFEITLGHAASSKLRPREVRYQELMQQIPQEYHDYLDVFDADLAMSKCPEHRPTYDFEIHLQEGCKLPPSSRPYHLSRQENEIMKEWLDGMLDTGMISRCTTRCPTAAPVFFVGKKDGSKRPVIDYRKLNDVTIRDSYPLPRIDQIMDQVKGSQYFSKFDMKSGYNQLQIKEGQEWLTAFITPHGVFQLNVMTFGFMNAPPVFQRFVDDLLYRKPELVNNLVGYLDDANTHNATQTEHIATNCAFFQRCREAGITLNPKKCEFHKNKVDFLGVELSAEGFEMERVKVDAIREWKPPRNVKGVREFIGFCNFYRRFVKNFAEVARPLHDLTKQDNKWEWGPRQQFAFQTLKDIICAAPVLIHPDPDERFRVETDASNYAYGAVLSQKGKEDQKQHPVAFFSKSMTPAERNYSIADKETLAIVKSLQHWRHWLEGTKLPIEILTDHKNLEYFTKPQILNRRQLRWADLMHHFHFGIGWIPGSRNGAADALSRKAEHIPEKPEEWEPTVLFPHDKFMEIATEIAQLDTQEFTEVLVALIGQAVLSDQQIQEKIKGLLPTIHLPETVVLHQGLPYHEEQIFVPPNQKIKRDIFHLYHDSQIAGHLGQQGTLELIRRMYWWPGQATDVANYIKGCHTCAQNKHRNWKTPGTLHVLPIPEGPWEWTQSDHITGLPRSQGYDAIYVVMDRLTKMAHFIPTHTTATAEDLVQLHLKHVWKHHGVPRTHNTDRGTLFTADYTRRFFKALKIDQRFSTAYHPETQGQVENNNKWIETYIRMFCNHQQNNWADLLHTAEFAYNNHHHPSIGMSPFKANVGYDMTLTGEGPTRGSNAPLRLALLQRLHTRCKLWLEQAQKRQATQYNKRRKDTPTLKEGDRVWLDTKDLATDRPSPKLEALRWGPFTINKVMGPLTYRLTLPKDWKINPVFHRSKIHPVTHTQGREQPKIPMLATNREE